MRGLFITGTGTEVGKTVVTAGILRRLRRAEIDAVPMKPVQTGAVSENGKLTAPDLRFCLRSAGLSPDNDELGLMSPFCYEPACSPHLAGKEAERFPSISHIIACARKLEKRHQMVIFEGAGGIIVPLNESTTMLDLMREVNVPVVLVALSGLGTINHTLLSVKALRDSGVEIAGIVMNDLSPVSDEDEWIARDNVETVRRLSGVPVLGRVSHLPGIREQAPESWSQFDRDLENGWPVLLRESGFGNK